MWRHSRVVSGVRAPFTAVSAPKFGRGRGDGGAGRGRGRERGRYQAAGRWVPRNDMVFDQAAFADGSW